MSESNAAPLKHDPFAALREPRFVLYTVSRVFGVTGQTLLQAVLAWHVYKLTGDVLSLGILGLVRFAPALALSLVGGAAADAYSRRAIILICQLVNLACVAVLTAATLGGWIEVELIYGIVVVFGMTQAFEGPARQALLPAIVPQEKFQNAVILTSSLQNVGMVLGPAIGGVIIGVAGVGTAYSAYVVIGGIGFAAMTLLRFVSVRTPSRVSLAAIREGVSFVRHSQVLLGAMSLDMFAVIFGGAQALLPVYATDILHTGGLGYGVLYSSLEVGAVAANFTLLLRPPILKTGRVLIFSVLAYGAFTIAFGFSRNYALSVLLYGLIGAADGVSVVMRSTTIQLATPDALRGRVSAVAQVFIGASNQVGAMESGFLAAVTSATFAVVSGGVVAIGVAGTVAVKLRELYDYRISRDAVPTAREAIETAELEEVRLAGGGGS